MKNENLFISLDLIYSKNAFFDAKFLIFDMSLDDSDSRGDEFLNFHRKCNSDHMLRQE
jgi:hypothetical protein